MIPGGTEKFGVKGIVLSLKMNSNESMSHLISSFKQNIVSNCAEHNKKHLERALRNVIIFDWNKYVVSGNITESLSLYINSSETEWKKTATKVASKRQPFGLVGVRCTLNLTLEKDLFNPQFSEHIKERSSILKEISFLCGKKSGETCSR